MAKSELRNHVLAFYDAIENNNLEELERLRLEGFPLNYAQDFAQLSLPEYAMKQGAVESAWWLMAQGVMPENWSSFSGNTWKTFLKKGFEMTVKGKGSVSIPFDAYKKIVVLGVKTTGEHLPDWIDKALHSSTNVATRWINTLSDNVGKVFQHLQEKVDQAKEKMEQELEEKAELEDDKEIKIEAPDRSRRSRQEPKPLSAGTLKKVKKNASAAAKKAAKKTL